ERRHDLVALVAAVDRPVAAGAERGVVAGRLVEPAALAVEVGVELVAVPVEVVGVVEHELARQDPGAAVGALVGPPAVAVLAVGGAVVPLERVVALAGGVDRHDADLDQVAGSGIAVTRMALAPALEVGDADGRPLTRGQGAELGLLEHRQAPYWGQVMGRT